MLRVKDLKNGHIDSAEIYHISPELDSEYKKTKLKGGEVLLSIQGTVGRAAIVPSSLAGANVSRTLAVIPPINGELAKWICMMLQTPQVQDAMRLVVGGSTRDSLNLRDLRPLRLPVAPLNEQLRIVAKLEKLLSRVEAAQARLATTPRILKRFRQSVLAAACSGRLTADWRKQNPNLESAEIYLRRNVPDVVLLDDGEIPASWVCCNLGSLSELITKGASPKWQGINYSTRGVLFVTSENVGSGRMLLDVKKYVEPQFNELQKRSILKSGDLLTNIVGGSIGRSAIYDSKELANINQAVAVIRLGKFVDRQYVLSVLNSPMLIDRMHKEKVDVARANLSLKDVADFPIPLAPPQEQQEIVRRVEALFKTADALEARYRTAKAHVDKLTQSILAKAFRGELVPQDPNDEPASVLLERIRQSKRSATVRSRTARR
jgi:restriction endonuclease S subunit